MSILVQKYGGTSVGSVERIRNVAERVIRSKKAGHQVVVVVSAMSGETDRLLGLAHQIDESPARRELDMLASTGEQVTIALLAMALHARGHEAISMTGAQVGIRTNSDFTNARIEHIETAKIKAELARGRIVIVAGFQGIDEAQNITTLGRGGSDTSAVALAAALKARSCEIYTDVDGVYTADPRKVPEARKLDEISYEEILELASLGAKVMHSRSIEVAMNFNVVLHIRSSLNENEGTYVRKETKQMENIRVSGVTSRLDEVRVTILDVQDKPGVAAMIFNRLAEQKVNVDMIVQTSARLDKHNDISFTIRKKDLKAARTIVDALVKDKTAGTGTFDEKIGILSIVGVGMKSHTGVAARLFDVLAKAKINISMISTSEIKISVVIAEERIEEALRLVHKAFEMDKAPPAAKAAPKKKG